MSLFFPSFSAADARANMSSISAIRHLRNIKAEVQLPPRRQYFGVIIWVSNLLFKRMSQC
jgi:hypothetical protein